MKRCSKLGARWSFNEVCYTGKLCWKINYLCQINLNFCYFYHCMNYLKGILLKKKNQTSRKKSCYMRSAPFQLPLDFFSDSLNPTIDFSSHDSGANRMHSKISTHEFIFANPRRWNRTKFSQLIIHYPLLRYKRLALRARARARFYRKTEATLYNN